MPTAIVFPNGGTLSSPNRKSQAPIRSATKGWTPNSSRRNTAFLKSVVGHELAGDGQYFGVSITLTLGPDNPPSLSEWQSYRDRFLKALNQTGAVRIHWCVEFQRRKAPHLHICAWYSHEDHPAEGDIDYRLAYLRWHWFQIASATNPDESGQLVEVLRSVTGWHRYCSKHMARTETYYQRDMSNAPENWDLSGSVGRMWGKRGKWPVENQSVDVCWPVAFVLHEFIARHSEKRARRQGNAAEANRWRYSRTMRADRATSHWVPGSFVSVYLDFARNFVFGTLSDSFSVPASAVEKADPVDRAIAYEVFSEFTRSRGVSWSGYSALAD